MSQIVSAYAQAKKKKPIVVYLDFHSDARLIEDGPHSGTWLSEVFARDECEKAYCVGLNLLSNSEATITNLDRYKVTYLPWTWEQIQRNGGANHVLPLITRQIIQEIHA